MSSLTAAEVETRERKQKKGKIKEKEEKLRGRRGEKSGERNVAGKGHSCSTMAN
jgi:hypothetical protein